MGKIVIGKYIRLSQADRDLMKRENKTESESVSHQRDLIQHFIDASEELSICEQYEFFDDGYSGTNFDRPSFERLMDQIKVGAINCVVVKDFSRFGRDYIELGDYLERIFPFLGVRFISVNDHYDSNDYKGTTGGLDVVMKNIVYDYYSKDLSLKVKTAKYQRMRQGKYLGGHVPYGLMRDPEDKHNLTIDPEAASVVREIFDMAIDGMRLVDIARTLNERGVETPGRYYQRKNPKARKYKDMSDKACWNHNNIRNILKQEMYYGAIAGHRRQGLGIGCKHTVAVPKDEQFIVEDRHEGIVTKEEFLKAQEIFHKAGKTKIIVPKTYPLHRKVKCGVCGRSMTYRSYVSHGVNYTYFACPHAKEQLSAGCSRRYVREDTLNEVVWSVLSHLLSLTDQMKDKMGQSRDLAAQKSLELTRQLEGLQREKEKCETERFTNVDQFMSGTLDKEVYQRRREELNHTVEHLEQQIGEAQNKLHAVEMSADDGMAEVYDKMKRYSGAEKLTQEIVKEFVEKVVVTDPEHVEIVWKFSDAVKEYIGI